MGRPNLNRVEFVRSAATSSQFIQSPLMRIAFSGKSNVGKSSVINRLLNRKNMARVGSEPGKTVHVNYFLVDEKVYFVDLPGYGFAKVSRSEKERWAALMESFFSREGCFDLGVMIVDARHTPTADDKTMAEYFKSSGNSFIVVANKTDKLKKSEIVPNIAMIRQSLDLSEDTPVIPFSAQTGDGREMLLAQLFPD